MRYFEKIGSWLLGFLTEVGAIALLFIKAFLWTFRPPLRFRNIARQMEAVGVESIPVVLITATFTGMVLALQSYTGFQRFNAEGLVGTVVALSMTRELGPVLTGLIVAGRAGAAMAAELGTMKVTEQIDALASMAVDPVQYLITPRLLAGMLMLPLLTVFSDFIGIIGGYLISVQMLEANPGIYIRRTIQYLEPNDIWGGLLKAMVFGTLIATISCYKGFNTQGGAEGVGRATTGAVVIAEMLILISDYFLTAFLF
ncbi:MlaE family ABC transporter permease [Candidatus Manganitrophus noduliformans]|uniref:ABC transporter permease n=1 Tax=Candidatus Manganitrophus noduliformans TaxID=2606439 RepID=A0A7X6DP15_9BACT|nr:ABC transporter permease [Candidatus Manganitrophus noduliformans]NKE70709.1 ABC transporter permease [Candidatus Manganitrophus noduliformans]